MPLLSWHGRIPFSQRYCLMVIGVIGVAYFAGRMVLNLTAMVDSERLVPISGEFMIQSIPFTLFLYLLGIVLVSFRQTPLNCINLFTFAFSLRVITGSILAFIFLYDDERGFHEAGIQQVYGLLSSDARKGYYRLSLVIGSVPGIFGNKLVGRLLLLC